MINIEHERSQNRASNHISKHNQYEGSNNSKLNPCQSEIPSNNSTSIVAAHAAPDTFSSVEFLSHTDVLSPKRILWKTCG